MRDWLAVDQRESVLLSENGSVSVEFSLWVPVIFFVFLLVAGTSAAFMAQAKIWHVAGDISRALATSRSPETEAHRLQQEYGHSRMHMQSSGRTVAVTLSQPYSNIGSGMALPFLEDMKVQVFRKLQTGVQLSSGEIS